MRFSVRLTARASQDIADVLQWFHDQRAHSAAERWFKQVQQCIASLESHPARCSVAPEAAELGIEIRQLLIGKRHGKFRILFVIEGRTVQIARVWRASRGLLGTPDL